MSAHPFHLSRLALLSLGLVLTIAPPAAGDPPVEVEVVNDPGQPVPVSVENGVLEVVVDNDASEAIPVAVEATAPEVPILIALHEWEPTSSGDVLLIEEVDRVCVGVIPSCFGIQGTYVVPDDKVLVIETISVSAQVSSGSPSTMAADFAITPLTYEDFYFALGRADYVYSKTKTWQTHFTGTLRAPSGSKIRGGVFWNEDVYGMVATMTVAGVLIDAPGVGSLAEGQSTLRSAQEMEDLDAMTSDGSYAVSPEGATGVSGSDPATSVFPTAR